jgi:hypothetical protein
VKNFILFAFLFQLLSCNKAAVDKALADSAPTDNETAEVTEDGISSSEKRIFLSSTRLSGEMGGISGANDVCQNLAQQAGLKKNYRALLAINEYSLSDQFSGTSKIFIFKSSGKELVSNSLTELIEDKAISNINFDEYSVEITDFTYVWTGVLNNSVSNNCSNWTSDSSEGAWALAKGSPECVDPNDLDNWMPSMMYSDSATCEANSYQWRNNEGKDVISLGDRMTCTDRLHVYCISE